MPVAPGRSPLRFRFRKMAPWPLAMLLWWDLAAGASPSLSVCTEYNCDHPVTIRLPAADWRGIERLFPAGQSAAAERAAIRRAIARLETLAGALTGTWRDRPRNEGDPADPGQLDCVAESINSHTYLELLAQRGLLRRHRVLPRESRNPWLFDFHWTAVIQELDSGRRYAVDSWYLANGEPPYIQPLESWRRGIEPAAETTTFAGDGTPAGASDAD